MFSVSTPEEARMLVTLACPTGLDGKPYAPELAVNQTLDNLHAFSERLAMLHDTVLVKRGLCKCLK